MFLLKYIVVGLLIYWIAKSIFPRNEGNLEQPKSGQNRNNSSTDKEDPKDQLGDYIDYEEID